MMDLGAELANHVWQSTVCVGAAAGLAWMLRRQAARLRYRVWLAASLKFLLPFSLLIGLGHYLPAVSVAARPAPLVSVTVRVIGAPFTADREDARVGADHGAGLWSASADSRAARLTWLAVVIWAAGALLLLVGRWVSWRRLVTAAWASPPLNIGREADALARARGRLPCAASIDLRASSSLREPGVIGTTRPIILWPAPLTTHLTDAELDAVFVHELSHVRRRDNLAAGVHALLETVLWFHPIVWWLGARLVEERERACDEEVLQAGNESQTYAASLLKVCDFCLQSPVAWVAGVTGAHLKTRVEEIMKFDRSLENTRSLGGRHRMVLALTALMLVALPLGLGALRGDRSALPVMASMDRAEPPAALKSAAGLAPPYQATTGGVKGVVTDSSGGLLIGAAVTIAETQWTTVTDERGRYALAHLPVGQYALLVQVPGFKVGKTLVRIEAGKDAIQDVRLAVGTVSESLTITDGGPPKDPAAARQLASEALAAVQNAPDLTPPPPPSPPASDGPVRVGGDIKAPKKIHDQAPVYPPDALAAGLEGLVIMEAIITTDGTVRDVRVLRSAPGLDQAAIDAVAQWVFTPTTLNGEPVEVMMTVTVNFTLH